MVLHVVTHRTWLVRDFTTAGVAVRHSLGLDLPVFADGDALWAPMEWAARALVDRRSVSLPLQLCDPGPWFMPLLGPAATGRACSVVTLRTLEFRGPEVGFFKPANCKIDPLPAGWWDREDFVAAARDAAVPDDTLIGYTATRLDLVEEHRVFVRHRRVATSSPYLLEDTTWHPGMVAATEAAEAFATRLLIRLRDQPPAFVLDVGRLRDGRWLVVETNPAWSSSPYGADLAAVADCLHAATDAHPQRWTWSPDPYLLSRMARQRPLAPVPQPAR